MEQSPGFLEQCAVGSLLYESVLEEVFRSGDLALFENEPRSDEELECIPQLAALAAVTALCDRRQWPRSIGT